VVEALCFLSDRAHPQWAGELPFATQAELIAGAIGVSGPNIDYLRDLVAHLRADGVCGVFMERLLARVEALERTAHELGAPSPPSVQAEAESEA